LSDEDTHESFQCAAANLNSGSDIHKCTGRKRNLAGRERLNIFDFTIDNGERFPHGMHKVRNAGTAQDQSSDLRANCSAKKRVAREERSMNLSATVAPTVDFAVKGEKCLETVGA
jgi:hypothetical protein